MGRLTLNVLLSFAQFEREVTGERIRDKIAASKKKGMWMGGPVPLGYDVRDRKLVVNEAEAETVRHICRRYLALGSVRELVEVLARDGARTKIQIRTSTANRGGVPFARGTLFHLLKNRIYLGEIVHKGVAYPGEHPPIVPVDLWEQVQAKLADNGPGLVARPRTRHPSLLVGLVVDGLDRRMTPSHANKGSSGIAITSPTPKPASTPPTRRGGSRRTISSASSSIDCGRSLTAPRSTPRPRLLAWRRATCSRPSLPPPAPRPPLPPCHRKGAARSSSAT